MKLNRDKIMLWWLIALFLTLLLVVSVSCGPQRTVHVIRWDRIILRGLGVAFVVLLIILPRRRNRP